MDCLLFGSENRRAQKERCEARCQCFFSRRSKFWRMQGEAIAGAKGAVKYRLISRVFCQRERLTAFDLEDNMGRKRSDLDSNFCSTPAEDQSHYQSSLSAVALRIALRPPLHLLEKNTRHSRSQLSEGSRHGCPASSHRSALLRSLSSSTSRRQTMAERIQRNQRARIQGIASPYLAIASFG